MPEKLLKAIILIFIPSCLFSQALEVDESSVLWVSNKIVHKTTKTSYDPLPKGTIIMYSGSNWVDNKTIPGWYACTSGQGTKNSIAIPNLENKFIRGGKTSDIGGSGGSSSITIGKDNLPEHTHSINHDHGAVTTSSDGDHSHQLPLDVMGTTNHFTLVDTKKDDEGFGSQRTSSNGEHSHSVDLPEYEGSSGDGDFNNDSISIIPPYYSVIYIIKVYEK